jgi:hypothetical protein
MKLIEFGPTLFRLPDDFVGGIPAALRALADAFDKGFTRTQSQKRPGRPSKLSVIYDKYRDERLQKFWRAVSEGATLDGLLILMDGDESNLTETKGWDKDGDQADAASGSSRKVHATGEAAVAEGAEATGS